MERHWTAFRENVSWFVHHRPNARPTETRPPGSWTPKSDEFSALFPNLTALLTEAWVTDVRLRSESWTLYTWESSPGVRGWLSPSPRKIPPEIHPDHRVLLDSFAGIVEHFGGGESWIQNDNAVMTAELAERDASFVEASAWAFEETGGIPVDLEAHHFVAEEANGNATLCHRRDGSVLLFGPDHAFDHVTVLEGCPEYTFYRLNGAPTFARWVETIADQWRAG